MGRKGHKKGRGSYDNKHESGVAHPQPGARPSLESMTSILRILEPNHMMFVEEKLRMSERLREGVRDLQGAAEKPISCGIDVLLVDPKEEQIIMEKVARRTNAQRLKQQRRARRKIEEMKLENELMRQREKERRHKNARMLLDGRAFDVKKKKFWFETGWNAERFMVPLKESEGEDEDEGDGEEKGVCCSIF